MFALILCSEANESDIVSLQDVKEKKGKTFTKGRLDWFSANALKASEDKELLDSRTVAPHVKSETPEKRTSILEETRHQERVCICSEFPKVTNEDLENLNRILTLMKKIHVLQEQKNDDGTTLNSSDTALDTEMELIEGSGIIVNARKVNRITNDYCRNAEEMTRKLMKLILGKEVLKNSSVTGKNGWTPIPTNVYEAVEQYVKENVAKKKYALTSQQFRQTVTTMCTTLRSPKSPREDRNVNKDINETIRMSEQEGFGPAEFNQHEMDESLRWREKNSSKKRKRLSPCQDNDFDVKKSK